MWFQFVTVLAILAMPFSSAKIVSDFHRDRFGGPWPPVPHSISKFEPEESRFIMSLPLLASVVLGSILGKKAFDDDEIAFPTQVPKTQKPGTPVNRLSGKPAQPIPAIKENRIW